LDLVILRILFVLTTALSSYELRPLGLERWPAAGAGLLFGLAVVLFEVRLRNVSLKRLIGAVIGSLLGIVGGYLFSLVIRNSLPPGATQSFLQLSVMLIMAYVGLVVGAGKGDLLNLGALGGIFGGEKQAKKSYKILDTSVIIDGRIADLIEAHFLEGLIVVPRFVLKEIQQVADSTDPIKRARGRRGLEMLNRIQRNTGIEVRIHDGDFPDEKDVDSKLVRLARNLNARLFTNDYNLAKVAQLQKIDCVNLHEVAKCLKVILLPGEILQLKIVREGKDKGQGVGYMPDGTMVVVNKAQSHIGQQVEVEVQSLLQTGAGIIVFADLKTPVTV